MTDASLIEQRLQSYSFYHSIEVLPGVFTAGIERLRPIQEPVLEAIRATPLAGKRVLDIGCRDGLFSFEAERCGASEVIGIDRKLSLGAIEFLIPHLKSQVKMSLVNVMDLTPATFGKFDVVIFAGVLYHLRYPFQVFKVIRDVMIDGGTLIIETGLYRLHEDEALLWCPVGEESPYEPSSVTFFNLKGITDTLRTFGITVQSHRFLSGHQIPHDRCTLVCALHESGIDQRRTRYWNSIEPLP